MNILSKSLNMEQIKENDPNIIKYKEEVKKAKVSKTSSGPICTLQGRCRSEQEVIDVAFFRVQEFAQAANTILHNLYLLTFTPNLAEDGSSSFLFSFTVGNLIGMDNKSYLEPTPLLKYNLLS